uniref:FAD-dependent oxidoreductase n=1 Tax=Rothia aeria TaxID=172042 RepID=UPI003C7AE377
YGDILRLQAPHPLVEHVVRGFVNGRPVYVIPRPGGEVCIGATSREDTRTRPGVDGVYQLLKDAIRVVPAVEECELIESNVGVRPGTPDDLPIFGGRTTATGRRQLISNGYFRHGILLAALAGKAGAEVFLGGDIPLEFAPCSPKRFEH